MLCKLLVLQALQEQQKLQKLCNAKLQTMYGALLAQPKHQRIVLCRTRERQTVGRAAAAAGAAAVAQQNVWATSRVRIVITPPAPTGQPWKPKCPCPSNSTLAVDDCSIRLLTAACRRLTVTTLSALEMATTWTTMSVRLAMQRLRLCLVALPLTTLSKIQLSTP